MKITVKCPAKINTFLSVGPPGAGGYHPIKTRFQAVSLFDDLELEPAAEDAVRSDWAELPSENTLTRTLNLLRELYPVPPLRVQLTKRIPAESGLGGGSSDAAGLIRAVVRLLSIPFDQHLFDIASAVGKDVPFFLVGGRAQGDGFGDKVSPLDDLPTSHFLIAKPNEGVSSAEGYRALDASPRDWAEYPDDPWALYNDFERVEPCVCGELNERMRIHGALGAGLSGSGSAVFGRFPSADIAEGAKKVLSGEFPDVWFHVCHSLTRAESLQMEVSP